MATTRGNGSSQGLPPAEPHRDPWDVGLDRLTALARKAVVDRVESSVDAVPLALARAVRAGRAEATPALWRRPSVWAWAGAAAVLVVVAFQIQHQRTGNPTLSYVTEIDQPPTASDRPNPGALARSERRYRFSDGTTVASPDAEAIKIEDTQRTRPRVRVARRLAHVRVVHHDNTQWTFSAGPYEVLVTGTTFDLGWDPAAEALSLGMHEGAVLLRGPHIPGGSLSVRAGQQVSISATTGALTFTNAPQAPGTNVASVPATNATTAAATPTAESPTSGSEPIQPKSTITAVARKTTISWRELVARGEFDEVIEGGRRLRHGCEERCSAEDLRALGDAARYKKDSSLATRAFQALRRRFPGGSDGRAAAYLLGRTNEAAGNWSEAHRWYSVYLTESPRGQFVVEAASGQARALSQRRSNHPRAGE